MNKEGIKWKRNKHFRNQPRAKKGVMCWIPTSEVLSCEIVRRSLKTHWSIWQIQTTTLFFSFFLRTWVLETSAAPSAFSRNLLEFNCSLLEEISRQNKSLVKKKRQQKYFAQKKSQTVLSGHFTDDEIWTVTEQKKTVGKPIHQPIFMHISDTCVWVTVCAKKWKRSKILQRTCRNWRRWKSCGNVGKRREECADRWGNFGIPWFHSISKIETLFNHLITYRTLFCLLLLWQKTPQWNVCTTFGLFRSTYP